MGLQPRLLFACYNIANQGDAGALDAGGTVQEEAMPITPRYLFTGYLDRVKPYLEGVPHQEATYDRGEKLWSVGEGIGHVNFIEKGVVSVSVVHEEGYRKFLYFMGAGSVYPGPHLSSYKIEYSIEAAAVVQTHVWRYDLPVVHECLKTDPEFAFAVIELYSAWCNLHIFETAHQRFNSLETQLCNLLFLLDESESGSDVIRASHSELAEILCVSRESVSRKLGDLSRRGVVKLGRNTISIEDRDALARLCSDEAVDS